MSIYINVKIGGDGWWVLGLPVTTLFPRDILDGILDLIESAFRSKACDFWQGLYNLHKTLYFCMTAIHSVIKEIYHNHYPLSIFIIM